MMTAPVLLAGCNREGDAITERSPAGLEQRALVAHSNSGEHRFIVELAASAEEQSYGLKNRQSLGPDQGMLFPYDPPRPVAFWMEDTLIPLDMVFVAPGGRVHRIESNTVPLSLEPVPSGVPVEAVLELAGGRAAEIGLVPGSRLSWTR